MGGLGFDKMKCFERAFCLFLSVVAVVGFIYSSFFMSDPIAALDTKLDVLVIYVVMILINLK